MQCYLQELEFGNIEQKEEYMYSLVHDRGGVINQ